MIRCRTNIPFGKKEDDILISLHHANTLNHVLLFTNKGKVYKIKGYEVPEFSRTSKGLPIINLLQIDKDEYVTSMLTYSRTDSANIYYLLLRRVSLRRPLLRNLIILENLVRFVLV